MKKTNKEYYEKGRIFLLDLIEKWRKTNIRCKVHKFFNIKLFSKGDIILLSLIFLFGAILYTPIEKFVFFVITTNLSWLSGKAGIRKIQKRMEKTEQVIENPYIPISKKYTVAVEAIRRECDFLGRVMDRHNLEQGTAPYLRTLQNIEDNKKLNEERGEKG